MATSVEELEQQHQQLLEIDQLLEASPGDESLLALRNDLIQLIELSTANLPGDAVVEPTETTVAATENSVEVEKAPEEKISRWGSVADESSKRPRDDPEQDGSNNLDASSATASAATLNFSSEPIGDTPVEQQRPQKKKKASSVPNEFTIPPNLLPNEQDSNAEANRKKRAVKKLKSTWRLQKKEKEATQKQKSWQSFQKKTTKKSSGSSMFSTSTDEGAKVGVVGGRKLTEAASVRKRHT